MRTSKVIINILARYILPIFPLLILLPFLALSVTHSYLLFHTTVELFSIIIASAIFLFAWNTRKISENNYFLFIGIAYLFVGIIDFFHTLTYKGMGVFSISGANIPTQLWIAERYVLAISILISTFFIKRKINSYLTFLVYLIITILICTSIIYSPFFPISYQNDTGLTPFKVISEYIISILFIISTFVLFKKRETFDPKVFAFLATAYLLNVISELSFTLYVGVYDVFNMLGHVFDLLAFYFLYKAIIEVGLSRPYNLLFLELKKLDQQKDDLLNITSHEIKNPLTAIKISSDLITHNFSRAKDKAVLQDINMIKQEADNINNLIDNLVDSSRIEIGKLQLEIKSFDFVDFVQEVVQSSKLSANKHLIILKRGKEIFEVKADRSRLGQVLTNLISNAIKYSPEGSKIIITIQKMKNNAVVSVQDFGIGLLKERKAHLFEKYYRSPRGQHYAKGLGLGLYIAKEIIKLHHGKIWAESEKDKGSTFYFSIPLQN